MRIRKSFALIALVSLFAIVLTAALGALPAVAKGKPTSGHRPVTKIGFKLDDHQVDLGTNVTGAVHVYTRSEHHWVPVEAALISLRVDGVEVAALTTDADGFAAVDVATTETGGHVMRAVFLGDDLHKRAQRAQGFEVSAVAEVPEV